MSKEGILVAYSAGCRSAFQKVRVRPTLTIVHAITGQQSLPQDIDLWFSLLTVKRETQFLLGKLECSGEFAMCRCGRWQLQCVAMLYTATATNLLGVTPRQDDGVETAYVTMQIYLGASAHQYTNFWLS